MKQCLVLFWGVLGLLLSNQILAQDSNWSFYKEYFLTPQGRIVDTGNNDISHSEGQGYGLILALHNNDKKAFAQIWEWSKRHLGRHDLPLFCWKYDPNTIPHVVDKNDASDGDLLIAWALLEAGKQWGDVNYTNASKLIRSAIFEHLVVDFGGYYLILPGVRGFAHKDYVEINLAYWVMPALQAFASQDGGEWQRVIDSGKELLQKSQFGVDKLPTDWIRVTKGGKVMPSPNRAPRFGFDAVRIPLYFYLAGMSKVPSLQSIKQFWQTQKGHEPAWINVLSGAKSSYLASQGVKAIIALVSDQPIPARLDKKVFYYSASLFLLSRMANESR
ncbi:Minor endoglucanase Y precursor [Marinomonas spartinae]|uniref:glycosyl hydrolase family 8 n=1 Tax=Marinomonas spartinae TaxID=1792290 RepID=UPI000808F4F0|nr:glycosyl hydrolase family 8 [Marinomonas spartinae]SBS26829.1 Minor endoglucanase Y precursor [Marinomonas spartinae]